MSTFTSPTPLTTRITYALKVLRDARQDGAPELIYIAQRRLDDLLDRLPRWRTLAQTHPELDKRLTVA